MASARCSVLDLGLPARSAMVRLYLQDPVVGSCRKVRRLFIAICNSCFAGRSLTRIFPAELAAHLGVGIKPRMFPETFCLEPILRLSPFRGSFHWFRDRCFPSGDQKAPVLLPREGRSLSSKGPDILLRYFFHHAGCATAFFSGWLKSRQGQGFILATSMKLAGKSRRSWPWRWLLSFFHRLTHNLQYGPLNSGSSSRNNTP